MPQKKTSTQLDREIAEALSRSSGEQPFYGLRIVPSQRAGYAPGKYVLQYKDRSGMWFDIGDPKSKREADAARKREEQRIVRPQGRSHARVVAIDTTTTIDRKFQSRQRDALTLSEKARQARGAAARWIKRSNAYAQEGEFRAADDAQTEGIALGRMADALEAEAATQRSQGHRAHSTKSQGKQRAAKPRIAHVETATAAGYRWLRQHAHGATVTAEGFTVTDEAKWAQSLRAAGAKEI